MDTSRRDESMNHQLLPIEATKLGELICEYRCDKVFWKCFFPTVGILVGLVFVSFGRLFNYSDAPVYFYVLFTLVGIAIAALGVYIAARYILEGNWQVKVFSEGMLLTRKTKNYALLWSQITAITQRTIFTISFGEGDGIPSAVIAFTRSMRKAAIGTTVVVLRCSR